MQITDIETILLSCPVPEQETWRLGGARIGSYTKGSFQLGSKGVKADMVIVRVHTDEGITGIGEPSPYGEAMPLRDSIVRLRPHLIGKDPFDVDLLSTPFRYGRRVDRLAMAGVNIACWDIMGKATG
ncbi:MAG: hypothetical protein OEZ48_01535, partial [Candidatus Bathyarchaeota archaeon]|nr:hypothetical protein [Candidatus Bathyarchaeota archaeon]